MHLASHHMRIFLPACCCSAATPPAGYGVASQEALTTFGTIMAPINGDTPASLMQQYDLTQALGGTLENSSYLTRGYLTASPLPANDANTSMVQVRWAAVMPLVGHVFQLEVPVTVLLLVHLIHPFGTPLADLLALDCLFGQLLLVFRSAFSKYT